MQKSRVFGHLWNQIYLSNEVSREDCCKRPSGVVCEKGHVGMTFQVGLCVQREWVVGGGYCGHCREQRLEWFHRRIVDYLSR